MKKALGEPASQRSCKAAAKPLQKRCGTPGPTGCLTREETTNLILQAQEAFNYQAALGHIEPGTKFDDWRRDQVMDEVGLPGISKIHRGHFRPVKARFLELAGRDDEALELRLKSGQKRDHGDPTDTYESSEALVAKIREALAGHATVPVESLLPGAQHIHPGWIIAAARQRTGKPSLTMDTLAERLDPHTLRGLLSHLVSHINLREGRAIPERRKPRTYPQPADPGEMDAPF